MLTAIPTPLPSALVAGAGTAGAVTMLRDHRRRKRLGVLVDREVAGVLRRGREHAQQNEDGGF